MCSSEKSLLLEITAQVTATLANPIPTDERVQAQIAALQYVLNAEVSGLART